MHFRLITFDVTNTLLKFRASIGQQYADIGALYGISCNEHTLERNFKLYWKKMSKEHPNFGAKTGLGWQNWYKSVVRDTFKNCNDNMDNTHLESLSNHLIEAYKTNLFWEKCHGADALLNFLHSRGISLGIISNFDPRLHETLVNNDLRDVFDFILTSYEVGIEKPSSDIFKKAITASKLDNLDPQECLHVGDTVKLDYFGAQSSGWSSYIIERGSGSNKHDLAYRDVRPEHLFKSLADLHKYLENVLEKCSNKAASQ